MPGAEHGRTAAERFVRSLFPEQESGAADLGVLAMERALIRERHGFLVVPGDGSEPREASASDPIADGDGVASMSPDLAGPCSHVADWLIAACADADAWLERLDAEGRPVKLTKIGSLDRAVREADKAMRRKASAMVSVATCDDDEAMHADMGEGWALVRLLTAASLDRESGRMQHCIGQGSYDRKLHDGRTLFLSMRDPAGRPHATLEIVEEKHFGDRVVQLQGKQNDRPAERYLRRIRPWLRANTRTSYPFADSIHPEWWSGYVRDQRNRIVDMTSPPDTADLVDVLRMRLLEGDVLPKLRLTSRSKIHLEIDEGRRSPVILPDDFGSDGVVLLEGKGTFVFGSRFRAGSLTAKGCTLVDIPQDFVVETKTRFENATADAVPGPARLGSVAVDRSSVRFGAGFRASSVVVRNSATCDIPDGARIDVLVVEGPELDRIGRIEGLDRLVLHDVGRNFSMPPVLSIARRMTIEGPGFPAVLPPTTLVDGTLEIRDADGIVLPGNLDVVELVMVGRSAAAIPPGTRIRRHLELRRTEGVDIGEGSEIGDGGITVYHPVVHANGETLDTIARIGFDPSISRIDPDGTCERRVPGFGR